MGLLVAFAGGRTYRDAGSAPIHTRWMETSAGCIRPRPTRLLLVGGPMSDRRALAGLIASRTSAEILDEVDLDEALPAAVALKPEGILIDVQLPDVHAVQVARSIRLRQPECGNIFLTSHADAQTLVATVFGRAAGHVVKTLDAPALVDAVEQVLREDRGRRQAAALIHWCEERAPAAIAGGVWQTRDLELLRLVAADQPDATTAATLGVDVVTVRLAMSELYRALSEDAEFRRAGATLARLLR